jgi:hypothetical protein
VHRQPVTAILPTFLHQKEQLSRLVEGVAFVRAMTYRMGPLTAAKYLVHNAGSGEGVGDMVLHTETLLVGQRP